MNTSLNTEEESGDATSPPPLPGRSAPLAIDLTPLFHFSICSYFFVIGKVRGTESGEAKRRSDPGNT